MPAGKRVAGRPLQTPDAESVPSEAGETRSRPEGSAKESGASRSGLLSIGEPLVELCHKGDELLVGVGGDALNVAARAAAYGLPARLMSVMSPDALGDWLAARIRSLGVELHARVGRGSTGLYGIKTAAEGEPRFSYWRSGTAAAELHPDDVETMPAGFSFLFVSGITQALSEQAEGTIDAAIAAASRSGVLVAYDPNYRVSLWAARGGVEAARLAAERVIDRVDILLPSAEDCRLLWDIRDPRQAAERLAREIGHVVVKAGPEGVWLNMNSHSIRIPGHPVSNPVDTTGAGDAFTGVYLAGLAHGLSERGAAIRAVEAATQTVRYHGALRDLDQPGDLGESESLHDVPAFFGHSRRGRWP